jgi:hypothetical protein
MRIFIVMVLSLAMTASQAPQFERVQPELFAAGNSLTNAWADYDGDGDLDLFVGFGGTIENRLYQNDRGTFREVAAGVGIADKRATRATAWGDYDEDGDPDLLVGFAPGAGSVLRFYRNEGGRFADITMAAGLVVDSGAVRQPVWLDLDGDRDLDLFVAFRDRPNTFYRNDGGRFTDIASEIGLADPRKSVGAVWFDYDDDSDLDLYVANQDGDANGLFRNDNGRFTDVAEQAGLQWGGRAPNVTTNGSVRPCAADVDNDGRLDLFLANYGPNGLFLNRGGGKFEDVSSAWGIAIDSRYDTCAFGDFDNDGWLDLYVNGTVGGNNSYRDYLYRNTGKRFEDVTPPELLALHASHGVQWADFDADGDLDLVIAGTRPDATHSLFRNPLPSATAKRSLQIIAMDSLGRAVLTGAEVRLYAFGNRRPIATRMVDSGSGYNSQNVMPVHFGMTGFQPVRIELRYPTVRGARVVDLDAIQWASCQSRVYEMRLGGQLRCR